MKKVLIVGAGWLGLPLAIELEKNQYKVFATKRAPSKPINWPSNIGYLQYNSNKTDIEKLLNTIQPNVVVVLLTPFQGLTTELKQWAKYSANLNAKLIYSSSTSVYPNLEKVFTETDSTEGGKQEIIEAENSIWNNHNNPIILRFAGLCGNGRWPAKYLSGKPATNPDKCVNLVYLYDCIAIIQKLILTEDSNGIFNVVSSCHPTRKDVYNYHCIKLNIPLPIWTKSDFLNNNRIIENCKLVNNLNYNFLYDNPLDYPIF